MALVSSELSASILLSVMVFVTLVIVSLNRKVSFRNVGENKVVEY